MRYHLLVLLLGSTIFPTTSMQAQTAAPVGGDSSANASYQRVPTPSPGVATVAQLEGLGVYTLEGAEIGTVRDLRVGHGGRVVVALILNPAGEQGARSEVFPLESFAIYGNRLILAPSATVPPLEAGTASRAAGFEPLGANRRVKLPFYQPDRRDVAALTGPAEEEVVTLVEILVEETTSGVRCRPPLARLPARDNFELRIVNRSGERAIVQGPGFFTAETLVLHQGVVPAAGDIGYVVRARTTGRIIMRVPPGQYSLKCSAVGGGEESSSSIVLVVVPPPR